MPSPKRIPQLSREQVLHTARCLLLGGNPNPKDAAYVSQWVHEGHFDGIAPEFGLHNLVGDLEHGGSR